MKIGSRLTFSALLFAAIVVMSASAGRAQATRTWVSGVGDDVNPCSRTAPCKTFTGAISKTATGGEICPIDPGGFGTLTITKSITIDGTATLSGVAANSTTGITINITDEKDTARAVRLRGLNIDGFGTGVTGVNVIAANTVTIEDSIIDGFATGVAVRGANVFVKDSTIRNNLTGFNVGDGRLGLSGDDIVFNGTAVSGTLASITWLTDVALYGNKSGDSKPAGVR